MNKLAQQILDAERAFGYIDHIAPGFVEPHVRSTKPATASGYYRMSELLPELPLNKGEAASYAGAINVREAGRQIDLKAAILGQSRVAEAGAQLFVVSTEDRPVPGAVGMYYTREGTLRLVKPAPFALVSTNADVATSAYPAATGHFKMADAPNSAVRFEISRRAENKITPELLTYEISQAIALGLAREMDRLLLTALAAQPLPAFTYGGAAAKGLRFEDLRAFIGTAGGGANVNPSGDFVATPVLFSGPQNNGVPAQMTDCVPATLFGAFATTGVAVLDEIHILMERRSLAGKLQVTVFLTAVPVIADPSLFWTLAA